MEPVTRIEADDDRRTARPGRPGSGGPPPAQGGAVYGLGMIGALVWFWRQADGVGGHAAAVGKAVAWPAFLVYEAFKALDR